jgi:RHS repeat-associated protein
MFRPVKPFLLRRALVAVVAAAVSVAVVPASAQAGPLRPADDGRPRSAPQRGPAIPVAPAAPVALNGTGTVASWGSNTMGQLGNGSTSDAKTPAQVSGLTAGTAIASGLYTGYAVKSDGTAWAWGYNTYGGLGDGTTTDRSTPVRVGTLANVIAVAGGSFTGYALKSDGTVWAWGNGYDGELGNGGTADSHTPVRVGSLTGVTAIAGSGGNGYALKSDGTVWSWGLNPSGQIGDGTTTTRLSPVQVKNLTGVSAIAAASGSETAYAMKSDGTVWSWGDNSSGQLGNGSTAASTGTAVQVKNFTGATAIAAGVSDGYALKSDGTVWSWGDGYYGQLGTGGTTQSAVPVQVGGLTGIAAIAAGGHSAYATRADGTARSWGNNSHGQLGNGTTTNAKTPVVVSTLTSVIAVAANYESSYALAGGTIPVAGSVPPRQLPGDGNPCLPCPLVQSGTGSGGDPVDTSSGAFHERYNDLSVSGRGPGLVWARSYNSVMAADDGPLGYGWHTGYGARLVVNATTGAVTVSQENGAEVVFTSSSGAYTAPAFVQATLVKNADGTYTFTRHATQILRFDSAGHLTAIADPNGEKTTLSYAGALLSKVTDSAGRALTVTYTGTHITKVSDPLGNAYTYAYDSAGNLTTVTAPDGGVTTFAYDSAHRVTSVLDPAQQSATTKHPTTNVYDAKGRVTSQTDALGRVTTFAYTGDPYSSAGGTTVVLDPAGHQTADTYQYGIRVSNVRGFGTAAAVTTTYAYDKATLAPTEVTRTTAGDPNAHRTTATYDTKGNPTAQVDGLGREADTTYNAFNEPLTKTEPNPSSVGPARITTTYAYDSKGNLLSRSRPLYTSATASTNQTVTYRHDDSAHPGDVTSVVDPLGKVTTTTYDSAGNAATVTTPQGRTTTYTYDADGHRKTTIAPQGTVSGADPAAYTTTFGYDPNGRLTSTSVAAPGGPLVTSEGYDLDGRLTSSTDPLGRVSHNTYDLAGELSTATQPDGSTRQTTYWPDGTVKTRVDGLGKVTSYGADTLGRVASVTDPLNRVTTYTYDAVDAVLTTTDPQNQVTTNTYDDAGQLLTTTYSDGVTPKVTRTYTGAGLAATTVDGSGTTTSAYDSLGRLTSQSMAGQTVGYGYDLAGRVTTLTYPNGKNVTRAYDGDGSLTGVTDWLGGASTFGYDGGGRLATLTAPNGVTSTIGHDAPGRTTGITVANGGTTLAGLADTWDAAGQLSGETSAGLGPDRGFGYDPDGRLTTDTGTTYAYDNAGQLTSNAGTTQAYDAAGQLTGSYTFDPRGNRTAAGTTAYSYDQANRLTSYTSGATTAGYGYNGDGLRTTKKVGTTTSTFAYDTVDGLPLLLADGTNFYLYGPGGTPIEQIGATSGTPTYLHADQLGSVRMLTAADGTVANTATYTAYGVRTFANAGGTTTPFGFAGQYTDAESGLLYLRARYYDPATGQFLTRDPASSLSGSVYAYADGDPIGRKDPSGLWTGGICLTSHLAGIVFWSGQVCIQIDGHGDLGVTATAAGGVSTPSFGAGVGLQGSNADQIKDLNGPFCTVGASVGDEYFGGADFSWGTDSQGRPVYVGELSGGVGAEGFPLPAEAHGGLSDTWSASFSIPKAWHWLTGLFD